MWLTVLKLGFLPWVIECVVIMVITCSLLGLSWMWGLLLGSIIAAVSPAVVVPSLFRLRKKGYGVTKGIPTLVIAVSSIDDALSVAAFGIISSVMFTSGSLTFQIIQGPVTLVGGIGAGIIWGLLSKYVPEKNDPYVVPLRILMLLGGGVLAMLGSESLGVGGAGPLSCVTAAFVSITCWSQQGWEIEDNPVATAFEIFWMIFEPILFGLTGTLLKLNELNGGTVGICIACLVIAIVVRILSTVLLALGSKLNLKEKLFVSLSWMSKAGVQVSTKSWGNLLFLRPAHRQDMAGGEHTGNAACRRVSIAAGPVCYRRGSSGGSSAASSRRPSATIDSRVTPAFLAVPPLEHYRPTVQDNPHVDNIAEGADSLRRKSFLSNRSHRALSMDSQFPFDPRMSNFIENGYLKKFSRTESVGVMSSHSTRCDVEEKDKSCWLKLGARRPEDDEGDSWKPPHYDTFCPPPLCPSYRRVARAVAILAAGLMAWLLAAALLGDVAAPGGPLFDLAALAVSSYLGSRLFALFKVPDLVGMFAVGILFQNIGLVQIAEFREVVAILREMSLVIILIRAGLDLDPAALNRMKVTVPKLALVPWIVECVAVAVTTHYLLDLPWMWGLLLGSSIAAVSPAVLVPCLCRLRMKGFGVSKGIPTLIVAVSGVDDATSVAIFSIIHSFMFSTEPFFKKMLLGPFSLLGGIAIGIFWGILCKVVPYKNDRYVVPLRVLMLLGGGLAVMMGSTRMGLSPAGPIACVVGAFSCLYCWSRQGWGVEHNPVNTAFEIFWMFFEPILFGVSGTQIVISELEPHIVGLVLACLISGILIRILVTILISVGSKLNMKEKIFVSLAWMSKAGVQAALAPVALRSVVDGTDDEKEYGHKVLLTSVLSILLTAPAAAVIISLAGPRLLKRTTAPPPTMHGRRASRLSIRSFAVSEDEEVRGVDNP